MFRTAAGVRYRYPIHEVPILDGLRRARTPVSVLHLGYADGARRRRSAERALRMLPLLPPDEPDALAHGLYHRLRALVALDRLDEVPAAAAALAAATPVLPPDVRLWEAQALLRQGDAAAAVRALVTAVIEHPAHPDPWFGLLLASTVAWLAAAKGVRQEPGRLDGPSTSLDHVVPVMEALVGAGLFERGVLDGPLLRAHRPPGGPTLAPGSDASLPRRGPGGGTPAVRPGGPPHPGQEGKPPAAGPTPGP